MHVPRETSSLSKRIESELIADIQSGAADTRLPSETEIAQRFGVSRVTVREALASLAQSGRIVRKHGLGTFINPNVLEIQTRLDESIEFGELIRATGHTAALALAEMSPGSADEALARHLGLAPGDPVLRFRKAFTADATTVIHVLNVVALRVVAPEYQSLEALPDPASASIYDFLANRCGQRVAYQIADVRALPTAEDAVGYMHARGFVDYRPGAPLLNVEEIGYNADDEPVFYSDEYYNTDVIQLKLIRKPRT